MCTESSWSWTTEYSQATIIQQNDFYNFHNHIATFVASLAFVNPTALRSLRGWPRKEVLLLISLGASSRSLRPSVFIVFPPHIPYNYKVKGKSK
jgi:hypothetical protein